MLEADGQDAIDIDEYDAFRETATGATGDLR